MTYSARGFTLIEILIALVIFAVVAVSVYGRNGETIQQLAHLENRTLAHWLALNRVAELELAQLESSAALATGNKTRQVHMADRQWRIHTEISNTSYPLLRKIEVKVFFADSPDSLETYTAFIGRY